MIRVGMVTTRSSDMRCGIAEYSRMLREAMPQDIEITEIGGPYDANRLLPRVLAGNYDVVHFQYESGFLGIFTPGVARRFGQRIVLTLHDAWWKDNRKTYPFVEEFDRVIVHQETNEGFTHIPHGIQVLRDDELMPVKVAIGTGGFPLSHKGIELVALTAALLAKQRPLLGADWSCQIVCPESPHVDTFAMKKRVTNICEKVYYETGWLSQTEVMRILSSNLVNVFPYREGKPGISAAVRMGLGTRSFNVLSKSHSFMDLWDDERYRDEVEWIEGDPDFLTPTAIANAVLKVIQSRKRPKRILEDMAWSVVAEKHAALYRGLM